LGTTIRGHTHNTNNALALDILDFLNYGLCDKSGQSSIILVFGFLIIIAAAS